RDVGCGMDEAKIDVGGRAAERHPHRVLLGTECEQPSFRTHPDKAGQMGVRLDPTGHDDLAARVDDAAGRGPLVFDSDRDDLFALHADVPTPNPVGSHDLAAANYQVE